ncbi:MAG TPA: type II secretion system F family protein [Alphaproteobacteria bacterium]|nr:type II secretion system F family protein [Alphaproteobacteria bacterium]
MISTQEAGVIDFMQGDALLGLATLAMIGAFWMIWKVFAVNDMPAQRLKSVVRRREDLRAALKSSSSPREGLFQGDWLRRFAREVRRSPWLYSSTLKKDLFRAGLRSREAPAIFILFKLVLPAVLFGLGLLLTGAAGVGEGKPLIKLLLMLGLPLTAFMLPGMWLKNAIQKREDVLRKSLPDAFDLLVICAEAGLGLDAALERVSREMVQSQPVLAEEIGITAVELSFFPDRRVALAAFAERVQLPSVRALVNTLVQSERYGTPLAQALRVLSGELREERMMKAEEKAARLPATLTLPMVMFILPTLFIVLMGPAIIQVLDLNK